MRFPGGKLDGGGFPRPKQSLLKSVGSIHEMTWGSLIWGYLGWYFVLHELHWLLWLCVSEFQEGLTILKHHVSWLDHLQFAILGDLMVTKMLDGSNLACLMVLPTNFSAQSSAGV